MNVTEGMVTKVWSLLFTWIPCDPDAIVMGNIGIVPMCDFFIGRSLSELLLVSQMFD